MNAKKSDGSNQTEPSAGPGGVDVSRLRLSQDFTAASGVAKALMNIPMTKPNRHWFVRVHEDPGYRMQTVVLELKEEREIYVVDRDLWPGLASEVAPVLLYTAITRQGTLFLWPVKLPRQDGRTDRWSQSAQAAAESAMGRWIRLAANMQMGAYDIFVAQNDGLADPEWPDASFEQILEVAFRGRVIRDADHPVLRRLRGEE